MTKHGGPAVAYTASELLAVMASRLLTDGQRSLAEPFFTDWERVDWSALPHSVIHNDGNDYNVLADAGGTRVVSLLDFGDMVHSATRPASGRRTDT